MLKFVTIFLFKESGMKIKFNLSSDAPHIAFDGELDEHTAEYVRMNVDALLEEFADKAIDKVIFDFSKLDFMDSTGVGVLLGRFKKWNAKNVQICIKNPPPQVDRVLKLSGIYQLMPLYV